jgi:hypothetical protein
MAGGVGKPSPTQTLPGREGFKKGIMNTECPILNYEVYFEIQYSKFGVQY